MITAKDTKPLPRILYSCYHTLNLAGEQFVPDHILSFQLSGSLTVYDGTHKYDFQEGDVRLHHRNHLLKFYKQIPSDGGEYKSVSVYFDQATLQNFCKDYGYTAEKLHINQPITVINPTQLYLRFLQSLQPYEQMLEPGHEDLLALKVKEALLILLKTYPGLKDILFDFTEPGKLDLEAFMVKNYKFNVSLRRFAYLTGRSLATFKRDFKKIFHTTPGHWLQQQRLREAFYLIKEKGRRPSEVYREVGFEDLSHFSFVFKKAFGMAPSMV